MGRGGVGLEILLMYLVGQLVGAAALTFIVSRLILWLTKTWPDYTRRVIFTHLSSLAICGLLGGIGMADGGAFAGLRATAVYAFPTAFWLVIDWWRLNKKSKIARER